MAQTGLFPATETRGRDAFAHARLLEGAILPYLMRWPTPLGTHRSSPMACMSLANARGKIDDPGV